MSARAIRRRHAVPGLPGLAAAWLLALGSAAAQEAPLDPAAPSGAPVAVTFRVNDAFVKDRMLAGVVVALAPAPGGVPIAQGTTDARGTVELKVAPGTYFASYRLAGYVPIPASETVVERAGQVVTTTLSMMLEAEGRPPEERRIRIILNWGSDQERHVRDADSHLVCACGLPDAHVSFQAMNHQGETHSVNLDVDDTEWGGPETVTLTNPPPGSYQYWVHDFSGGPGDLGRSQVVVRVLYGDVLAAELRPAVARSRTWRPFRELVIGPDFAPLIVPFTAVELGQGLATHPMPEMEAAEAPPEEPAPAPSEPEAVAVPLGCVVVAGLLFTFGLIGLISRRRRRR